MRRLRQLISKTVHLALVLAVLAPAAAAQNGSGRLKGRVTDELGAVIPGASIRLVSPDKSEKVTSTGESGEYEFNPVNAGNYSLQISARGFAAYAAEVEVMAGHGAVADVRLTVELEKQQDVVVTGGEQMGTDPERNAGALVIRGGAVEALPDDPDEMAEVLRTLAGPSAGPGGAQIYVDGFTADGRLPAKSSIKEVVINQNPFTAEFERLGFGRIQITTRPGGRQYHGQGMFHFNDETLNTRNALGPAERTPFQLRYFTGVLSGPLDKRSSFFLNAQRRQIDDNAFIAATVLDPSLRVVQLNQGLDLTRRETYFGARADYQFNPNHILQGQYAYTPSKVLGSGVGDFNLASRALDVFDRSHTLRLTETDILRVNVVNETRFQYMSQRRRQLGLSSDPTLRVLDAFTGGGAAAGFTSLRTNLWEAHNYTTVSLGAHTLRFGGRFRQFNQEDVSPSNFNGTYIFAGGLAPALDAQDNLITGAPVMVTIDSIERYRRTLALTQRGLSPAQVRALGGGASQFSIAGGDPEASVGQRDVGLFVQEDWRLRPNFTLALGLRYEAQSNISSNLSFAPRVSFAWSPTLGKGGQPTTVVRGGFGVFYDRIPPQLALQARRFNGVTQQQYIVTDPAVLDLFPAVPSVATLGAFAQPQTTRRVADDITSPYTSQAAISVERQLPRRNVLTATYIYARALHLLRSRNVNAPLASGLRPRPELGNVFAFESSGVFKQHQLIVNLNSRMSPKLELFATYALNKADSDTDGVASFPADPYDLRGEYGRSALDVRHRLNVGASYDTVWGLNLNGLFLARSGQPFNIFIGRDINNDLAFAERPAFATDLGEPGVVVSRFGAFDPTPSAGQTLVPRNYGTGPTFYGVNFAVSKTFSFGGKDAPAASAAPARAGSAPAAQQRAPEKPYKLTFSVRSYNLFNRNNLGLPVGNLSSSLFGESNTTASEFATNSATSNRRVWLHVNFAF
jgi:hypothetical protein